MLLSNQFFFNCVTEKSAPKTWVSKNCCHWCQDVRIFLSYINKKKTSKKESFKATQHKLIVPGRLVVGPEVDVVEDSIELIIGVVVLVAVVVIVVVVGGGASVVVVVVDDVSVAADVDVSVVVGFSVLVDSVVTASVVVLVSTSSIAMSEQP